MNGLSDLPVSGSSVLILGSGPIGLSAVQIARYMGAKTIIVAARKKTKLDIALMLGADQVINTTETDIYEEITRLTNGERANIVLETSGDAEYVESMTRLVALEGIFSIVGFYNRTISSLNMDDVVLSKLTLCGRCGSNECTVKLAQMLEEGTINIKPIITHQIDFYQDIKRCMELYHEKKDTCVKMLVRIAGEDA
jgi:L-iditol 2-dehydrogenase